MKKFLLFFSVFVLGVFSTQAQTADTLENPGFEQWESVYGLPEDEPVNWSGIKTSDNPKVNPLAPVNWARSDKAHSGKYSLKLYNVASLGLVATGTMSNGRYHTEVSSTESYVYTDTSNAAWNTHFDARPDSLIGWFMCNPVSGDHGNVLAILHTGYARTPMKDNDSSTWIAKASFDLPGKAVNTWTRFSVPFKYYSDKTPQYILIVLTSGNGANAIAGSVAWFDDLNVVFRPSGIHSISAPGSLTAFAGRNRITFGLKGTPPGTYKIELFNILGRVQYSCNLQSNKTKTINISLPTGIYLLRAQNGNYIFVKKILFR